MDVEVEAIFKDHWCVLIYTPFIRPKPDLKDQKLINYAKYILFLYLCMCMYGYVKNGQTQVKNRQKRARD
jgi:hypothetical protein